MTPAQLALRAATFLTGLSAGFFLSYETSVTLGLEQVDDVTYVRSFQAINDAVSNPVFAATFFGPLALIATALALHRNATVRVRSTIGTALVLYVSVIAITGTGNVPLNDELADVAVLDGATAAAARDEFEEPWNRLNLIRTVAAIASFSMLALAAAMPAGLDTTDRRGARRTSMAPFGTSVEPDPHRQDRE